MTWGQQGLWGQHGVETMETTEQTTETTAMRTTWGPSGGYGDDRDNVGMMWGWRGHCGDHRDNKIAKNAITFEQIKIIEFHLKIWDPWTLPTHVHCNWCVGGGCSIPNCIFIQKVLQWPSKKFFPVFALDPIRPYLDWALRGFLTSWPIYDPLKLQPKWKQSAKFD